MVEYATLLSIIHDLADVEDQQRAVRVQAAIWNREKDELEDASLEEATEIVRRQLAQHG